MPNQPLTEQQITDFNRDGYLFVEGLLNDEETRVLQETCRADAVMMDNAMAIKDAFGLPLNEES